MKRIKHPILFSVIVFFLIGTACSVNNYSTISEADQELFNENISHTPESSADPKKWTIMVYLDADCNLEGAGIDDMNEMEMEGSDSDVNVIVQIDRIPGYDSSNGNWNDARRYYMTKDYSTSTISSTVQQYLGEVNMGLADTLQNFVQWGKSNYPADNYALILWDHGSGIMYGSNPGGVCWDDSNNDAYLTLAEIESVLSTYSVDLLGFDACLMGMVEVHYQLKDYVDVIVGSEENEPGDGYPYNDILNYIKNYPDATPSELGQQIVIKYDNSYPSYYDITQAAAVALTPEFVTSLQGFSSELNSIVGAQKSNIQTSRSNSLNFGEASYIDLYDFANEIKTSCSGPIQTKAQYLMDNITDIIIEERHSSSFADAHGFSIYFPESQYDYAPNYENSDFATDLQWDEFLTYYYTGAPPGGYDDIYEENDDFPEAKLLTSGSYNLICDGSDSDFFNVTIQVDKTIEVQALFDDDEGDIDLFLYDTSQTIVNSSYSTSDDEQVSYTAPTTGNYTIKIEQWTPYQEYQPYTLIIEDGNDDSFEDNDVWGDAAEINNNTLYTDLICKDPDFYEFWATDGWLINVTIEFNYAEGDLDLYLYSETGVLYEASYTATSNENVLFSANYSGWFIVEVYNYEDNLDYTLSANVTKLDDYLETGYGFPNNNYINYATPITNGTYQNLVCMNEDFYNITLFSGDWVNVTIYFNHSGGDLDLYLLYVNSWDPFDYDVVGFSISFTDDESVFYEVDLTGPYYIWVTFEELNMNYTMCINNGTNIWDDSFEENDWFDNAPKLNSTDTYNNLTAIDWDTFYISVPKGNVITIILDHDSTEGDLDLYLIYYDDVEDIGWILDRSTSYTDQEIIQYEITNSGNYHILVYPYEFNMEYNLTLSKTSITLGGGDDDDDDSGDGGEFDIIGFLTSPLGMVLIGGSAVAVVIIAIIKTKGSGKSRLKEIERIERLG
jgi:hypothetical protein